MRHDPETLLHGNHLRSGRGRRLAEAPGPEHLATLSAIGGDWLVRRGYEEDRLVGPGGRAGEDRPGPVAVEVARPGLFHREEVPEGRLGAEAVLGV